MDKKISKYYRDYSSTGNKLKNNALINYVESQELFSQVGNKAEKTVLKFDNMNLTKLPDDLSEFTNLVRLDISSNPFTNFSKIGCSLATLPQLKELLIDLPNTDNVKQILEHLPLLEMWNNKPLVPGIHPNPVQKISGIDVTDEDIREANFEIEIEKYNTILHKITALTESSDEKNQGKGADISKHFKEFLTWQIEKVNEIINQNLPNYWYAVNVIQIKIAIYSFLQKTTIQYISTIKTESNEELHKLKPWADIIDDITILINEKQGVITNIINALYTRIQQENSNVMQTSNNLLKENSRLKTMVLEYEKEKNMWTQDRKLLIERNTILKQENLLLTSKIIENAKSIQNQNEIMIKTESNNPEVTTHNRDTNMNNKTFNNNTTQLRSKENSDFQYEEEVKKDPKNSYSYKYLKSNPNVKVSKKVISKETWLEIISEIYKSKSNANKKCLEMHLPIETMEQHMYKFLNTKYGLKHWVIEYASGIINGIKEHSRKNWEICLFGMILRSELEENSINILHQIKQILNDTLVFFLKEKYPYKNQDDINTLAEKSKAGFIDEEIWNAMIDYIWKNDAFGCREVKNKIYGFINRKFEKAMTDASKKKLTIEEKDLIKDIKNYQKKLAYKDWFNFVLEYHLRTREKFLRSLRRDFTLKDRDGDGIWSQDEFISLVYDFDIFNKDYFNEEIERWLRLMPQCEKFNSYTFSEIVTLFEKEVMVNPENNQRISILEYVSQK